MPDDLDRLMDQLGTSELPRRLDRLEADLVARIASSRPDAAGASWRFAAIGIALVAGVGVGGTSAFPRGATSPAAPLRDGAGLAPSALLSPSR